MRFRQAVEDDAASIAALHADSWRTHYRGAYSDSYLEGHVHEDRRHVWLGRLSAPAPNQFVLLAEGPDGLLGFACAFGQADSQWGSLLDNLHVKTEHQGKGIGAALFGEVVKWCNANYAECGLHLWVLEQNVRAQALYRRLGASDRGAQISAAPGGGQVQARLYAWTVLPNAAKHKLAAAAALASTGSVAARGQRRYRPDQGG